MEDYLLQVKNEAKNLDLDKWQMLHVVLGSEACDLDSAVSTIIYAYLLHETQKSTGTLILPVLNVSRRDIRLKTEVTFFLEENDMSCDLLVLKNEIDLKNLHNCGKLMLTLVDHNALVKPDVNLQSAVVEIIDHHKRSLENYGPNCKTTIEMVGSCATLVAERVFEDHPALIDAQLAVLLGGTILLDTVCLDDQAGRVTDRDKLVVKKLQKYFPDVNHRQLFQSIQQAKFDISGLSVCDLLRKDLKVVSNSAINIAIVSLPVLVQDLMQRIATLKDLKKFNSDNNYHTLVLMGIQTHSDTGDVQRDMGVYSINYVCKQQVVDYLIEHQELGLEPCDEENEMMCLSLFRQVNVNASRKMVLPLLVSFLRTSSEDVSQLPFKMRNQETEDSESATKNEGLDDFSDVVNVTSANGIVSSGGAIPVINVKDTLNVPLSSQNSSNQNSSPRTPLNSYVDGGFAMDVYAQDLLPSFNSRDMMEKIEIKRGNLRDYESDVDQEKYPFTPKNSFVDSNFDSYMQQMPPIDVDTLVERVHEARLEGSDDNGRGLNVNSSVGDQLSHGLSVVKQGTSPKNGNVAFQKEQLTSVPEDDQHSDAVGSQDGCFPVSVNALSSTGNPESLEGRVQNEKSVIANELEQDSKLNSPDDNSLGSSRGDKGDEKMDISTSGSDKEASSPATVPITHSDSQLVNSTTDRTYDCPTQFGSSTSTLSTGQDLDSEMALNYQAETVDFPDSPHHMKLLTRRSTDEFKGSNVEDEMGQDEDEVFKAVLSPGAEDVVLRKDRPTSLSKGKKKKIRVTADILNEHDEDDAKSLSSLSNKSADLLSPGDDIATPDDIETPDELEDSLLEGVGGCSEPIPELSAAEEYDEERSWRTCIIAGVQRKIDMKVIDPYKKVLSHGGYCTDTHYAIIVFSACYLPDRGRRDYDYVMDNLFLYVLTTLDQLVAEDYVLIYLHGATQRSNMPSFGWLKRCYQMIDRRLRKNLKGLYLVHPTFWLKTIVLMTKPFISTKFSRKLRFIASLQELAEIIPMDHVCIPDKVKQYDEERLIAVTQ